MSEEDGEAPRVALAMATGSHGVVSPFDGNAEEWIDYAERLENYFVANNITDIAKRRAILLIKRRGTIDVSIDKDSVSTRFTKGFQVRGTSRMSPSSLQPQAFRHRKVVLI